MAENKIGILNRVFSRSTFKHLINSSDDKIFVTAVKRYVQSPDNKNNYELISEIYKELRYNYRNEYFYKNTLLNKLLIGVHSVNTTTALTEIPIYKSKADFILINGKAVVYEIKTELDNFERLQTQVNDYYKAFNYVTIVTCEENLKTLLKKLDNIKKPVGIYILTKKGTLSHFREPLQDDSLLDKEIIFKILRKAEYEEIIKSTFNDVPNVTQFKLYDACKEKFMEIPIEESYSLFLHQLKKRTRIEKELFAKVPYELKFLAYFTDLNKFEYKRLEDFLSKQFGGV